MSVTIAGIEFEHYGYDERADVLYLTVAGYEGPPADAYATPGGHGIEYDEKRRVIAMTLVNLKWQLDRDRELTITWPRDTSRPTNSLRRWRPRRNGQRTP